jgi:hypothetical protein
MAKRERIRAVRRVIGLVEALIDAFGEVADELAAIEDEIADAAFLGTAQDRLASAKDSAATALAPLRQERPRPTTRARRASEAHAAYGAPAGSTGGVASCLCR